MNPFRWLKRRFLPRVELFFHHRYAFAPAGSPADPQRGPLVLGFLAHRRLVSPYQLHSPRPIPIRRVLAVHDHAYLESLRQHEVVSAALGGGLPVEAHDRALESQRYMTGGTLEASRFALETKGITCSLGGGLHHARRGSGRGFCLFNDVAIAIHELRRRGFSKPILVVDLDLHDGDGTREIFAEDESVWTFSVHNQHWADPEATASTAIELGPDVEDPLYLETIERELPRVFESFQPRLVFYLAGCDPAADDILGDWNITPEAMLARDLLVTRLARRHPRSIPLVVLPAGGYGRSAWRYTARYLGHLLGHGKKREPPPTEEMLLQRFRRLAVDLPESRLHGRDALELTEEDILGGLGAQRRRSRFLDFYTRHGLELIFERTDLFTRLEDLGYPHAWLELDLDNPTGDTLRIWDSDRRRSVLIEVRLRRDRRSLPGFQLLACEWLLLQNPDGQFGDDRPPLPGQKHPGLGLLNITIVMLVLVCERLELDGLVVVPAHYHIAVQATRRLRFAEPEHADFFAALQRALEDLPLALASKAVESGRVRFVQPRKPFEWPVMPMVLDLSESLTAEIDRRYREHETEDSPPIVLEVLPAVPGPNKTSA